MHKYAILFLVALQDAFSERGSALTWAFLDFLGPLMMLFIWLAIYQGQKGSGGEIGGYNLSQMLTYYFGVALISAVATAHNEWEVAREIQSGELSAYLTRPISYLGHHLVANLSWKILKGLCVAPFLLGLYLIFKNYLSLNFTLWQLAAFGLVLVFSYLLNFFNSMVFGLIPFWLEEYGSFVELNEIVRSLFSGMALPIAFLPGVFLTIGQLLPYRYLYDFPLRILAGQAGAAEVSSGLVGLIIWLLIFAFAYSFLWRKGAARYSAYGG